MSTLVRITAHNTPHYTDPADAGEFYAALGMLSVGWGRLEGHLTGNLLTITNFLERPPERLPFRWDDRMKLWSEGFSLPALQAYKNDAVSYMKLVVAAAEDRNFAAHAIWDSFVQHASEPTMTARSIKAKAPNTINVDDKRITLSMVKQALEECNRLNREMGQFTQLIGSIAPPPVGALRL